MASNSKDANKGVVGVASSKKSSKSKGSSMAAVGGSGAMVEGSRLPSEGRGDSQKFSRSIVLKFSMSRKSKPKNTKDSAASRASKASSRGEGVAGPAFSSKD